jgi:tetratricopeptide (TPR) repeat protein
MCEALGQQTLAEKLYRCGLNYAVRKRADLFVEFFSGCIANTYCARGDTTTAIALLNQRLAENPRSASGYYDLAKVYLFIENKEAAIENYRKALELESDEEWKEIIRKQLAHLSS